jgi:uncharacterized membrane protein YgaE (UPF0421/DUF939 family)
VDTNEKSCDFFAVVRVNALTMKALILFVGWCILFVLCWPLAILALVLLPVVWLLSLPLRLVGITLGAVFAFIKALLFLPARLLGGRPQKRAAT